MCARRSAETRRQSSQTAPHRPSNTGHSSGSGPSAGPSGHALEVDAATIDVIDQRARRRAQESRGAASGPAGDRPAPRSLDKRRVAPTVVHVGDRTSGPVSGAIDHPLSSRGPGLEVQRTQSAREADSAGASIIVSPQLAAAEPPLVVPAPAPRPPASAHQVSAPTSPTKTIRRTQPYEGMTAITGPSPRPTRKASRGPRPGTIALAAAALFALGFVLLRNTSTTTGSVATASVSPDRAEREQAGVTTTAPTGSTSKVEAPSRQGDALAKNTGANTSTSKPTLPPTNPTPTNPELAKTTTAPALAGLGTTAGAGTTATAPTATPPTATLPTAPATTTGADRVERETPSTANANRPTEPAPSARRENTPSDSQLAAPVPPRGTNTRTVVAANTPAARNDTALAARKAPAADTAIETTPKAPETRPLDPLDPLDPIDPTDPGSRYDHVPPKSALAEAAPVPDARRYDHVPPKAALASASAAETRPATPAPEKATPTASNDTGVSAPPRTGAEDRERARRYDHVPPKAAQVAAATDTKAEPDKARTKAETPKPNAAPLSGSPRIYLQSDPPGATVAVLGQPRGKTPISLDIDGQVEVVLTHPEHRPATVVLEPSRGPRWLSIKLDPR